MKSKDEVTVSRKIYVRHRPRVIKREGEQYSDQDSSRHIGAAFDKSEILRGLDFDEEKKYLKSIIGVSPTSEKWDEATKRYWANIRTRVPYGMGLELEIGFVYKDQATADKAEASDDYNVRQELGEPLKVSDYVLWRYCLVYGRVANTLAEVNNSNKIRFYLYSKEAEVNDKYLALEVRKKAMNKLILITGDRELVDQVLTVYNHPRANIKGDKEKDIALEELMSEDPGRFIKLAEDPQLKTKAIIELAIMRGHLRRVENTDTIIYGDNTPIGNSVDDAVAYLNTPRNLTILNNIKAKLSKLDALRPPAAERIPEDLPANIAAPSGDLPIDDDFDNDLANEVATITQPVAAEVGKGIKIRKPQSAT